MRIQTKTVAIIVAHPDDETLWAGGTILNYPYWKCFIVCLSRVNDPERAPRFYNALKALKSDGVIGDLNDEPDQKPLSEIDVEHAIIQLLPFKHYDLIITHNPTGEYTRHIRHEEISRAVIMLWQSGKIFTNELWTFAYEDGNKHYHPKPIEKATIYRTLTNRIWLKKYSIITETYGFKKEDWEAETTPKAEAFWQFLNQSEAIKQLNQPLNK
jgi:LmbE family N-acetylglucosaminyl deacetylase